MNRFIITLTLIASLFTASAFATEEVHPVVLKSFEKSFSTAQEVSWAVSEEGLYKASFTLNGNYANAYFNANGDLVAVVRNISSLQLPVVLQAAIKRDYNDFWITELFEVSNETGNSYYIILENGDSKITLSSISNTEWRQFKKSQK